MFKDMESTSFLIAAVANGFEVRSPHTAASKSELTKRLASLTVTKRKQLAYLMQSTDWAVLPPHERAIAETIYDDIVALEEDTGKSTERISKKLSRLEMRLAEALNRGDFSTSNGGLAHLLSHHPGDTEDTDDSPDAS
jgi:hypothetical protein